MVERNRVLNCSVGGPYHDFWNGKSIIIRNNYYHNVYRAVFENLGTTEWEGLAALRGTEHTRWL